jgi:ATP-dependent helicase HrpA
MNLRDFAMDPVKTPGAVSWARRDAFRDCLQPGSELICADGQGGADNPPPVTSRAAPAIPPIEFPESLPVSARRDEIARAIDANPVVIVCGETGSGKTTQLPKIALQLGRGLGAGGQGLIGHTQPRRIAASSVAKRIAQELGTPLGEVVGYKVRFQDRLQAGASVTLMTDGILMAETQATRCCAPTTR